MDGNDGEDSSSMVGSTGSSAEGGASCGDSHSADSSESENETGTGDSHDSDEGASDSSSATASSESHVGSNDGHGDSVPDEQHSSPPSGGPGDSVPTAGPGDGVPTGGPGDSVPSPGDSVPTDGPGAGVSTRQVVVSADPALSVVPVSEYIFETTEDHLRRHNYPANRRTCSRCAYWKHRVKWSARCTYICPSTGLAMSWLAEQPDPLRKPWGLGCILCHKAGKTSVMARFEGVPRIYNIVRHGNATGNANSKVTRDHMSAVREVVAKAREELNANLTTESPRPAEAVGRGSSSQVTMSSEERAEADPCSVTVAHAVFTRTMLSTAASFKNFTEWAKASRIAGAPAMHGSNSEKVPARLTQIFAEQEMATTEALVNAASMAGIAQDGRKLALAIRVKLLIWRWPKRLDLRTVTGVSSFEGDRGPWVCDRLIGVPECGSDQSAEAKTHLTHSTLQARLGSGTFEHLRRVLVFFCSDNAADEKRVGLTLLQNYFPKLAYQIGDASHTAALVLRNAIVGDVEVAATDALLVTGKDPPSLAKFVTVSDRVRCRFRELQKEDGVAILSHFGWAPQRFASRSVPYGRIAMRLKEAFDLLEHEVTKTQGKRRDYAKHLLENLSGPHTGRLLIGAMLADLSHEHARLVREGDKADPDPVAVARSVTRFKQRIDALFTEGMVFSGEARDTFTGQVITFLKKGSRVYRGPSGASYVVSMGTTDASEAYMTPLHRVRNIVTNVKAALHIHFGHTSWHMRLSAYALPNPFGQSTHWREMETTRRERIQEKAKRNLFAIWRAAGLTPEVAFKEWSKILPYAEQKFKEGMSLRAAWAMSSTEWPEFKVGRVTVSLLLCMTNSTSSTERTFTHLAAQERGSSRSRMEGATMESILVASQAPGVNEAVQQSAEGDKIALRCKTGYYDAIVNKYHATYGKAHIRQTRKRRRDAGVPKDCAAPSDPTRPEAESHVLRKREVAMNNILKKSLSAAGDARVHSRLGGFVPTQHDTEAIQAGFLTDKGKDLRERAKRKREEDAHDPGDGDPRKPASRAVKHRLLHSWEAPADEADVGRKAGVAWLDPPDARAWERLRRSGFLRVSERAGLNAFCSAAIWKDHKRHIVVLKDLSRCLSAPAAIICRLVGGFLTSHEDVWKCGESGPSGIGFESSLKTRTRTVFVSASMRAREPLLHSVLYKAASLPSSRLVLVDDEVAFRNLFTEYKRRKGDKSKPWLALRAVVSEDEKQAAQRSKFAPCYKALGEDLCFWGKAVDKKLQVRSWARR